MAPTSTVNDDTIGTTMEVQSDVGITLLGNTVREVGKWAHSIRALVYEAEGNYFVDQLNRM
jgi:hypothetical protein